MTPYARSKLDIKSFIKSLIAYRRDALREVFIKYELCPAIELLHRWRKLPSWLKLLEKLLREDRFLLIVLDACRYDSFQFMYKKYLRGKLVAAKSLGPDTYEWLPRLFSAEGFMGVKVFYAGTKIRTHDVKLKKFVSTGKNGEVIGVNPRAGAYVALPHEVNSEVFRQGLAERTIVWYMQPHYPWIHKRKLSLELLNEVTWQDFTPKDLVKEGLKRKGIARHEIIRAYLDNLEIVLEAASTLIEEVKDRFKGKIIITSDHGELLGEYGLYMHPHYELPQLCVVPWLEV